MSHPSTVTQQIDRTVELPVFDASVTFEQSLCIDQIHFRQTKHRIIMMLILVGYGAACNGKLIRSVSGISSGQRNVVCAPDIRRQTIVTVVKLLPAVFIPLEKRTFFDGQTVTAQEHVNQFAACRQLPDSLRDFLSGDTLRIIS